MKLTVKRLDRDGRYETLIARDEARRRSSQRGHRAASPAANLNDPRRNNNRPAVNRAARGHFGIGSLTPAAARMASIRDRR